MSTCISEIIEVKILLSELNINTGQMNIFGDNQSALCMAKNSYSTIKHIDLRFHFISELIINKIVKIIYHQIF